MGPGSAGPERDATRTARRSWRGDWRLPAPIATRVACETARVMRAISHSIPAAVPPPDAFFPSHLSVALIDAVFGARRVEQGGGSVADRYCRHFGLARTRAERLWLPPVDGQETLGELVARYENLGVETMADTVFRDLSRFPRTSHFRAGYVVGLARGLRNLGIDTLQDMGTWCPGALDVALRVKAGFDAHVVRLLLSYGIDDDFVWGNDAVRGFVARAVERETVSAARAAFLVRRAAFELILSPRHVDYRIWTGTVQHSAVQRKRPAKGVIDVRRGTTLGVSLGPRRRGRDGSAAGLRSRRGIAPWAAR